MTALPVRTRLQAAMPVPGIPLQFLSRVRAGKRRERWSRLLRAGGEARRSTLGMALARPDRRAADGSRKW